jgi:hypothetical protein
VSITLLAPRHPRPDEVPKEVKDYLDRIVFLMHQHLPVFRPSAGRPSLSRPRISRAGVLSLASVGAKTGY